MNKLVTALCAAAFAVSASAEFKVDRSVMSEKYWAIWNDAAQAKIDADGREQFKFVDVK